MEEGTISRWLKKVGDPVEEGEVILEIETDKGILEVESFSRGVLHRILAEEGETVPVQTTLAVIAEEGEELDAAAEQLSSRAAAVPDSTSARAHIPVRASPIAKKIAKDNGLDLSSLKGTGPEGRITKEDVLNALASSPAGCRGLGGRDQFVELTSMRHAVAQSLQASKQNAPHFYTSVDIDMTECLCGRMEWNRTHGIKASINDVILIAAGDALCAVPRMNVVWDGDRLVQREAVNIGIAVPVEDGLVVPVLQDVTGKTLSEVARESRVLITKAKDGKLVGQGSGTFTVSNMGMYGIKQFAAIINPPECAILAVGAVEKRPVVIDGDTIAVRSMMTVTLSCDHRVIDGGLASEFLNKLKSILQAPRLT